MNRNKYIDNDGAGISDTVKICNFTKCVHLSGLECDGLCSLKATHSLNTAYHRIYVAHNNRLKLESFFRCTGAKLKLTTVFCHFRSQGTIFRVLKKDKTIVSVVSNEITTEVSYKLYDSFELGHLKGKLKWDSVLY
jgi:hypothetical protein